MRPQAIAARRGSRPPTIVPPSSGGSGIRLNTPSTTFIATSFRRTSWPRLAPTPKPAVRVNATEATIARTKLLAGPANAIVAEPRKGLRSRKGWYGTGLAQPIGSWFGS